LGVPVKVGMVGSGRLGKHQQLHQVPTARGGSALWCFVQRFGGGGGSAGGYRRCRSGIGLRAGQIERTLLSAAGNRHTQGDQSRATRDADMGERSA